MSLLRKSMEDERIEVETISNQLRDSVRSVEANKPDFRELDLGSPVSPLRPRGCSVTTTSSSSSSGSVSGNRNWCSTRCRSNQSGEVSISSGTSPRVKNTKQGKSRSEPLIYSGAWQSTGRGSPSTGNVVPLRTGNVCRSGEMPKTTTNQSSKTDFLKTGTGKYGHGSIVRGNGIAMCSNLDTGNVVGCNHSRGGSVDAEDVKKAGNESYKKGNFGEALILYDKAIALQPENAAYRSNRAAALTGLGRFPEAMGECEEAVRLDPHYWRAHQRLVSLFIRLGLVENARQHVSSSGQKFVTAELQKLQLVEKHIRNCYDARRINDWNTCVKESEAAITAGADDSTLLCACRAEAILKLHRLDEAESCLLNISKPEASNFYTKYQFLGMNSEAYLLYVRAQINLALGKFEDAVGAAKNAGNIDQQSGEVAMLVNNVILVSRARGRGNDLFKSERYTEACSAYGDGLKLEPSNSVLYCNRAACWFKLGLWARSIDDCNQALLIHPDYTKAILRRAASNCKLEKWAEAVCDYEVLRRELPNDNEVAESLFHAQVALKKSRGEEVFNLKFGGEVEEIARIEEFRTSISLPGVSLVYFKSSSNSQCKQIATFLDTLCNRYPSINFLMVDIEKNGAIATMENVQITPTFKIYKGGNRMKEIVCPSHDMLEQSVRHYSL